jgi:hypothetical protein
MDVHAPFRLDVCLMAGTYPKRTQIYRLYSGKYKEGIFAPELIYPEGPEYKMTLECVTDFDSGSYLKLIFDVTEEFTQDVHVFV